MSKPSVVTVYSAPWCVFCKMVKEYLNNKNVAFKEINVDEDQAAAQALVDRTNQMGVPVIEIGNETILGFDRQRIDLALRDKKLI
ncbi:glutaredoxin family protein [Candidatus Saccharibacteria bacterium]|nr:glutaredoxin family protein [Candidatus Saccharibacteria bacterium]